MRRRTFLQATGALAAAGLAGCQSIPNPTGTTPPTETKSMRIDPGKVDNRNQNRSTVACLHGMACTSQPLASLAGVDMLRSGGNAIDAAIAANAVLSLVEPMNCGPGGDLFAIVWIEKEQKLFGLNASGRSPYAWNLAEAQKRGITAIPPYSPLAWSVPGCVSGWKALLDRFGSQKTSRLFEPVIRHAREGFPVSPIIASDWAGIDTKRFPTVAATFAPNGKSPAFGEIFSNPDLASFYEILIRDGLDAFYQGEPAERIVRFSQENGGLFAMKDFQDHQADWVEPAGTSYRGYDIWEIPPNGQGICVLQMLNMLEHFDIGGLAPNSPEQLHLFVEAKKLAYEDRAIYYADPAFADVPLDWLISKDYGAKRAKLIDPKWASEAPVPGEFDHSDTIYLTTADAEGNMVSLIQSTYHGWGSHLVPDRLGFALQNRGSSFALDEKHRNRLEPHKRPFHTIIPAFVTQGGRPVFSFGVMGGAFQPQGHTQVLMNLLDYGMSPQQAGEQPRIEHNGSSEPNGSPRSGGGTLRFEHHIPESTKLALAGMGHQLEEKPGAFGGYQGIWREEGPRRYFGGTDPRKDGCATGY
ncbi:MAG: gamma-glutamyltransferase family protein [Candidatus Hydrogenedentes bacterium]|nr:gamma-glutamyltransferase family protein [Candidatus Hydrogenedentota bacterium]